ncbi:MAG TPA: RES domain-containing protein [Acidimicrobiales bacterium]|nr:RES domain-containing protein [Acidimicrobiales bacterium]
MPRGAAGRVDNPEQYDVLYLSDGPGGACAETFAYLSVWNDLLLLGSPLLPDSVAAIATYALDAAVCDLDDAARLVALGLRPSSVVTRERPVTQAWALRLFAEGRWAGVRWWSYHDPRWGSHGIWDIGALRLEGVEPVTLDHPGVGEAAEVLARPVHGRKGGGR